jgi:tetratricopeptide (TPR) repeat protein
MDIRMLSKSMLCAFFLTALLFTARTARAGSQVPEAAKAAFAEGDYPKAIELLNREAAASPRDAEVQYLLARCYYEDEQFDRGTHFAERAVALDGNNSTYHELLGRIYGERADRSGWLGALSLAKKSRKEFETAVRLDEHNYSAMQALIEFDCSAPSMAGGGEDKARPEIERLSALDAAQGYYAAGNCRRQKKDNAAADTEFRKVLALHPKSADLIYDLGDHYMKHSQADRLQLVIEEGERVAPEDPRGNFFRAVKLTMEKKNPAEAAKLFHEYVSHAPKRNNYPSKAIAHYWLGRIQENQNDTTSAKAEYREALNLEPKNRFAREAMSRLQHD